MGDGGKVGRWGYCRGCCGLMYLWCFWWFWWWDDGDLSVAVALGDFGGPVTTERDTVMLAEVGLGKE